MFCRLFLFYKTVLLFLFPVLSCFLFCLYVRLQSAQFPLFFRVFCMIYKTLMLYLYLGFFSSRSIFELHQTRLFCQTLIDIVSLECICELFLSPMDIFQNISSVDVSPFQLLNGYSYFPQGLQDKCSSSSVCFN